MSEISLSSRLPKGDANGLGPIVRTLISEPERVHAVLMIVDCKRITTDTETGETVPTMRIRRVEAVRQADLSEAQRLVKRAWQERNGDTILPLELEDDIKQLFSGLNLETDPEQPTKPQTDDRRNDDDESGRPPFSSGN